MRCGFTIHRHVGRIFCFLSVMFQSISLSDDQPTRVLKTKKHGREKDENNFEHRPVVAA